MDKIINDIYDQLSDWKNGNIKINAITVISLVPEVIRLVEKVKNTESVQKKNIALLVIRKIATEEKNLNEKDKKLLLDIIDTTVPIMIDTMISIYRHRIDLGKGKKISNCICY